MAPLIVLIAVALSALVTFTGICDILGAVGLLAPRTVAWPLRRQPYRLCTQKRRRRPMTHHARLTLVMLATVLVLAGCGGGQSLPISAVGDRGMLVGAWRSKMVFRSGPLAAMKDLEFLYAYNLGGTMTESSNYDEASNSSPPAYGLWRQIGARTFETKYVFYTTKEPDLDGGAGGTRDWWPAGHGVLTERITLSDDRQTYVSTVKLTTYDRTGAPIAPDGEGTGAGTRIVF